MSHSHDHHHDPSAYYTEQLCTIGICGAIGGIAIAICASGVANNVLKEGILQYSLLGGGIALLALVCIRAAFLWVSVGQTAPERLSVDFLLGLLAQGWTEAEILRNYPGLTLEELLACRPNASACDHDHDEECCDHEHEHESAITSASEGLPLVTESGPATHHHHDHDHAHGHGHSHGGHDHAHDHSWAPIRYIVLLVPVLLYFFVPLDDIRASSGFQGVIPPSYGKEVQSTGDLGQVAFRELVGAADIESRRKQYDGKIARLVGQFVPSPTANQFSLVRMKIRCCAADAVALPFPILLNDSLAKDLPAEQRIPDAQALNRKWVQVTCQILFRPHPERPNEWVTLLVVRPTKDMPIGELIKPTLPDPNPYL
jgi:hypothetical protein